MTNHIKMPFQERLRLQQENDPNGNRCWLWTGALRRGYGAISTSGKLGLERARSSPHRVAWELLIGPLPPKGMHLDHLCRNRSCYNPRHLEAVSIKTNLLRGEGAPAKNARKTHCTNGHALSGDNLAIYSAGRGRTCRTCRACKRKATRIGARKRRARQRLSGTPPENF